MGYDKTDFGMSAKQVDDRGEEDGESAGDGNGV